MHTPLDLTVAWTALCLALLLAASLGLLARVTSTRRMPRLVTTALVLCAALFAVVGIAIGGLLWLFLV